VSPSYITNLLHSGFNKIYHFYIFILLLFVVNNDMFMKCIHIIIFIIRLLLNGEHLEFADIESIFTEWYIPNGDIAIYKTPSPELESPSPNSVPGDPQSEGGGPTSLPEGSVSEGSVSEAPASSPESGNGESRIAGAPAASSESVPSADLPEGVNREYLDQLRRVDRAVDAALDAEDVVARFATDPVHGPDSSDSDFGTSWDRANTELTRTEEIRDRIIASTEEMEARLGIERGERSLTLGENAARYIDSVEQNAAAVAQNQEGTAENQESTQNQESTENQENTAETLNPPLKRSRDDFESGNEGEDESE
jgi:hypothetical protein